MEMDPSARKELIEFARSQMARNGQIDTLIFTSGRAEENIRES